MLKIFQPPQLPNDLEWKFLADPELCTWTIRARNYNILIANIAFFLYAMISLTGSLVLYYAFEGTSQPWRVFWSVLIFVTTLSLPVSGTYQRINVACRITTSGMEYCEWKKNFRINPKILGGITIFVSVAIIFLAANTPGLSFVAILGPGGMGIMALMQLNSQRFQEPYSEYNHLIFDWEQITQLTIATNSEAIALQRSPIINEERQTLRNCSIFCEKGQKEAVAELIRSHLSPNVPVIRGRVSCV
ncbi:hypothetical protein SJI00_22270 [Pseudomonas sp. RP23018S]|uniref:hypothetical protein n=1 Tax=Pseudomonas sp. RP23018S TaxID=3096037 RepID=UPI002ACA7850|nr:hypothetical protein [Pseudomonas sp. RP23018S]MDZ5605499.1 hypothetical protein [Pseudomonas sp. RP23018S]